MNVEIVTEAAQFPEKEYINGIFLAVYRYSKYVQVDLFSSNFAIVQYHHRGHRQEYPPWPVSCPA